MVGYRTGSRDVDCFTAEASAATLGYWQIPPAQDVQVVAPIVLVNVPGAH